MEFSIAIPNRKYVDSPLFSETVFETWIKRSSAAYCPGFRFKAVADVTCSLGAAVGAFLLVHGGYAEHICAKQTVW